FELDDAVDVAEAELGALDVADDRNVASDLHRCFADCINGPRVLLVRAVREVEAEDVDARREEAEDRLFAAARGAESGDDFCASQDSIFSLSRAPRRIRGATARPVATRSSHGKQMAIARLILRFAQDKLRAGCSARPRTCAIASHSRTTCANASGRIACGPSESASSGL